MSKSNGSYQSEVGSGLCLFIEGRKVRPTGIRVLEALCRLGAQPNVVQYGATVSELVAATGLSRHVVRARLHDLRRKGLVESDYCPQLGRSDEVKRYAHFLTVAGERRVQIG